MKQHLTRIIERFDDWLAAVSLRRRRERPALLAFLFHGVFESPEEIAADVVWPSQPLLVQELKRFIEYFLAHGYCFVSPADILAGLDPNGYHAFLTFDDGYANNQRALPILRALSVPATFFISARHVAEGKAFWWDAVYREGRQRGSAHAAIRDEIDRLRRCTVDDIEAYVRRTFGAAALRPLGDTDRAFTAEELRAFATDPLVTLGNHTMDHMDLTRHTAERGRADIRTCQEYLTEVTGSAPRIIAYPYGSHQRETVGMAAAEGLQLGVTVAGRKNGLPLTPAAGMTIARAFIPCGPALLSACERSRSDLQLRRWVSFFRGLH